MTGLLSVACADGELPRPAALTATLLTSMTSPAEAELLAIADLAGDAQAEGLDTPVCTSTTATTRSSAQ